MPKSFCSVCYKMAATAARVAAYAAIAFVAFGLLAFALLEAQSKGVLLSSRTPPRSVAQNGATAIGVGVVMAAVAASVALWRRGGDGVRAPDWSVAAKNDRRVPGPPDWRVDYWSRDGGVPRAQTRALAIRAINAFNRSEGTVGVL